MSIWDRINGFIQDVAHGDLSGALGDAEGAAGDVLGAVGNAVGAATGDSPPNQGLGRSDQAAISGMQAAVSGKQALSSPNGAQSASCCNRFTFDNGFLVDGVTGRVWQFNQKTNSFTEVPVSNSPSRQKLVDTLIENKLNAFRCQYEQEILGSVAPASRPKLMTAFEKEHIVPLRDAAKAMRY